MKADIFIGVNGQLSAMTEKLGTTRGDDINDIVTNLVWNEKSPLYGALRLSTDIEHNRAVLGVVCPLNVILEYIVAKVDR